MSQRILHIDGPPMAYVEALEDSAERLVYRTFRYRGRNPEALIRKADKKIREIEEQACLRAEILAMARDPESLELSSSTPIILWRARPRVVAEENEEGSTIAFSVRFRLTTIPELTEEQWDDLKPGPLHFKAKQDSGVDVVIQPSTYIEV